MAVVVTAVSGFDLGYVWKNQGAQAKAEGGYYYDAPDGEVPGRWWGPGVEKLGLTQGSDVQRSDYDAVYSQVNPRDGSKIGSRPGNYQEKADHLARLLAAEPHATAERVIELEREAAKAARVAPAYTDMTVSFSKSISLLGASIRANARQARVDGDAAGAAYWDGKTRELQEILHAATRAGLEHVQRWAGVTRTGHHGARVAGQEPGRYEAADLVFSAWLQGTSRDGAPQDHVHCQLARMAFTASDGKARAADTMALRAQLGAVRAITAAHVEATLTRAFGVEWRARADGAGNEIKGVSDAEIDVFSARTRDIDAMTQEMAREWEARNGRAPSSFELQYIAQRATMRTRQGKEEGVIDWDEKAADWDRQLRGALDERLADIAPRISGLGGGAGARQLGPAGQPPTREKQQQAIRDAVELIGSKQSTWTRADLMKQLQPVMPPEFARMDPDEAVALLDRLTDEAVSGRGEVVPLASPEWPPLPASLRRELDGKSIYTRPGIDRFASRASLSLEKRLVADAQRTIGPHLTREEAGRALGTDPVALEDQLQTRASDARRGALASGLRVDQGSALFYVLTSPRVAEVLVGPAGTGKTFTAGEAARSWIEAGRGIVVGTATSQNASNELTRAGVHIAKNTTQLIANLGKIPEGSLIWLDEGSMVSMEHAAQIVAYAAEHGCKVVISGDQQQLAAVEGGGAMMLLASRMGYVQLGEPVRFANAWEGDASLRLRRGDATALDEYSVHGRIRGGDPEWVMREAARAYVAAYLEDRDVILTAMDWDRCRELSRRIRADLVHLGKVDGGRTVELSAGQVASAGDRIIARKNDHRLDAGEAGRGLANGDVLVVEEVTDAGLIVRRVMGTDRETGERVLSDWFTYRDYRHADLAYAVTGHSAQGATREAGIVVVSGTESRQWVYSAMTRGVEDNTAYVVSKPRKADPASEPLPAPELQRQAIEDRFRAGQADEAEPEQEREPIAVLAEVVERDGTQLAALEMQRRNLSDTDNIAAFNVAWDDLTRGARVARYEGYLRNVLPPGYDTELGHQATWLWRTVAQAEAAGLDVEEVIRTAVESRSLAGSRDVASVIDARIRERIRPMAPLAARTWTERTPELADPEHTMYARSLAAAMDARVVRLGEHETRQQPAWLVNALGPVPEDPLARLDYEHRASKLATYRELYGYTHPDEAIGPEPTWDSPDRKAHWQAAAIARTRVDEADVTSRSDVTLWHMRSTYATITAGAPEHPGRVLTDTRIRRADAERTRVRAEAEAVTARARNDTEAADRHEAMARTAQEAERLHAEHEDVFADQAEVRERWARLTEGSRMLAVAADAELRARYPEEKIEPLASAEPVISDEEKADLDRVDETLTSPTVVSRLAERQREHWEKISAEEGQRVPAEDPDAQDEGPAWGSWLPSDREAILQPPVEVVEPAPELAGYEKEG